MTTWRRISPWCWSAIVCGIECRVWLAADGERWHAGHNRESPTQRVAQYYGKSDRIERRTFDDRHEARRCVVDVARKFARIGNGIIDHVENGAQSR